MANDRSLEEVGLIQTLVDDKYVTAKQALTLPTKRELIRALLACADELMKDVPPSAIRKFKKALSKSKKDLPSGYHHEYAENNVKAALLYREAVFHSHIVNELRYKPTRAFEYERMIRYLLEYRSGKKKLAPAYQEAGISIEWEGIFKHLPEEKRSVFANPLPLAAKAAAQYQHG